MWAEILQALVSLTSALPDFFRGLKARRRTDFAKALARLHGALSRVISSGEDILLAFENGKPSQVVMTLLKDQMVRLENLLEQLNEPIIRDKLAIFLPDTVRLLRMYDADKGALVLKAMYELRRQDDPDSSPPVVHWRVTRLGSGKVLYLDEARDNLSALRELTEQLRTFLVDQFSMDDLLRVRDEEGST